jgi:hypothetical protein
MCEVEAHNISSGEWTSIYSTKLGVMVWRRGRDDKGKEIDIG